MVAKFLKELHQKRDVAGLVLKVFCYREQDTAGHLIRVNYLSTKLAEALDLPRAERRHLYWGSLLHDIGKLALADGILHKAGALQYEEYDRIKAHPLVGYEFIKDLHGFHHAADVVLYHHERYDGTGYPHGLKGKKIPLSARICSVADAFDAMISDRVYREAQQQPRAIREIIRGSGNQFDPRIVNVFCRMLKV